MFRKSVSFFILLALLWILLWVYIPDTTPEHLSISDFFRSLLLLFSLLAAGFAFLMLIIRYKGVDLITSLFPQSAVVLWLGKHAYQYSQPQIILYVLYNGPWEQLKFNIVCHAANIQSVLTKGQSNTVNLGVIKVNPTVVWHDEGGRPLRHELNIMSDIKRMGRNRHYQLVIEGSSYSLKLLPGKI